MKKLLVVFLLIVVELTAKTIYFPKDYVKLNDAVAFASENDTILIASGKYYGTDIGGATVSKSLVLMGEGIGVTILCTDYPILFIRNTSKIIVKDITFEKEVNESRLLSNNYPLGMIQVDSSFDIHFQNVAVYGANGANYSPPLSSYPGLDAFWIRRSKKIFLDSVKVKGGLGGNCSGLNCGNSRGNDGFSLRIIDSSYVTIKNSTLLNLYYCDSSSTIMTENVILSVYRQINSNPNTFTLEQNFPNPFNPLTMIKFYVETNGYVALSVHDLLGREVKILIKGIVKKGQHQVSFDASNLASGVYLYRLIDRSNIKVKKMVIQK